MTIGLSPKLYPALIAIAAGLLVAVLVDDTAGLSILGTGIAALGLGYQLPPGEVVPGPAPASDDKLGGTVLARIEQEDPAA